MAWEKVCSGEVQASGLLAWLESEFAWSRYRPRVFLPWCIARE